MFFAVVDKQSGIALGLVPAHQFYVDELSLEVEAGDLIAFYTAGVTEAMALAVSAARRSAPRFTAKPSAVYGLVS